MQVALKAEERCEGHGTLLLPFSMSLLVRNLTISAKRRSTKLQCYSCLLLSHPAPACSHTCNQEGPTYLAVRTQARSYTTIWLADKVHGTDQARDRGICGIIQNCLKPLHYLQFPFIFLLPSPFLWSPPVTSIPANFRSSLSLKPYFFLPAHISTPSLSTPHWPLWAPHTPY